MAFLPSVNNKITIEETSFDAPVSESTMQKVGSTVNWVIDNVNALNDLASSAKDGYGCFNSTGGSLASSISGSFSYFLGMFPSFLGDNSGLTLTNSSTITITKSGKYLLDFSDILVLISNNIDPIEANMTIYLSKNGSNIFTLDSGSGSSTTSVTAEGNKLIVNLLNGDYIRVLVSGSITFGVANVSFTSRYISIINLGE